MMNATIQTDISPDLGTSIEMPSVLRTSIDPLISTGRGSYVPLSRTSLAKLLASFDRAYPEYTDSTREDVIAGWRGAKALMGEAA